MGEHEPTTADLQAAIAEEVETAPSKRIQRLLARFTGMVEVEDGDA